LLKNNLILLFKLMKLKKNNLKTDRVGQQSKKTNQNI
jgi:hypothetical protein